MDEEQQILVLKNVKKVIETEVSKQFQLEAEKRRKKRRESVGGNGTFIFR